MRRPPALVNLILVVGGASLSACGGDGSGWVVEAAPPRAEPTTVSLNLGEAATLHGPGGLELQVILNFTHRPPVPVSLSPENATFLEVHLSVTNSGSVPFAGVLADAADLAVLPSGTLAPIRTESVPVEIALSRGLDFAEPLTIAPGTPPLAGKVVFQIDPDDDASAFSLTIVGARETAEWAL
jgi:hypothetical protein